MFQLFPTNDGVVGPSDGAGKLSVPGCPTNLDSSRAKTYCVCSGCGVYGDFSLVYHFFVSI